MNECRTCKFWVRHAGSIGGTSIGTMHKRFPKKTGECRFAPPVVVGAGQEVVTAWPEVLETEGCSFHREVEDAE